MSYEYLYPKIEKLKDKPFVAIDVLRVIESWGFKPIAVSVDNNLGSIKIHFENPLTDKEKRKLDEKMNELLKNY